MSRWWWIWIGVVVVIWSMAIIIDWVYVKPYIIKRVYVQ